MRHDVSGVPNALKIAVEPSKLADLKVHREERMLLNQADPFVVYTVSQRGDHVFAAAGEISFGALCNLRVRFAEVQMPK